MYYALAGSLGFLVGSVYGSWMLVYLQGRRYKR